MEDRVGQAAERLLERLEQAVRELDAATVLHRKKEKTDDEERIIEYVERLPDQKSLVDRNGLKQLTGVLKDLRELLVRDPELDSRERELRLNRIERELDAASQGDGLTVVLEGEAEDYAG